MLSVAAGLVPKALSQWRSEERSRTAVIEEYRSSAELESAAADGRHDFAIGPKPHRHFEVIEPLGWEEFVVVMPAGDPALDADRVDVSDLVGRPWVLFRGSHGLSSVLEGLFAERGLNPPEASVLTSQTDVAVSLAVAGLGPTVVPSNVVPAEARRFARSLGPAGARRELYLYATQPVTALAVGFAEGIRAQLD